MSREYINTPNIYTESFPRIYIIATGKRESEIFVTIFEWIVYFPTFHFYEIEEDEIGGGRSVNERIYRSTNIHPRMNGNYLISVSAMFNNLVQV